MRAAALAPALGLPALSVHRAGAIAPADGTPVPGKGPEDERARLAQAILPTNRVLSYYGYPGNDLMGILGEMDMPALQQALQAQADAYAAVDDSKPWKLAFEVITSVAQREPQEDNSYLLYILTDTLQQYVDYTAANDLLLIMDLQFGRRTVKQELDQVEHWLRYPHVHLALDPEFAVKEGEVPGEVLGTMTAADVTYAQQRVADFCAANNLPPKLLMVHQFNYYTLPDKENIKPVDGVDFVLEVDGWGPPNQKQDTYRVLAGDNAMEHYGFKLWYQQDEPIMSESDVMALTPTPDVVIYQ